MERVYVAANLQEAYLILHRIQHAGIGARVLNEHAASGLGDLPFTHIHPEVWVEDPRDAPQARALVREYEAIEAQPHDVRCAQCGEDNPHTFELCWRCAAPLS